MRDIGDESSAGSTPPPPSLDDLSPFLPSFPQDDDLWRHLLQDGWCFFSDDKHTGVNASAASEPFRQSYASAGKRSGRPPQPSSPVWRNCRRGEIVKAQESRNQDCDNSVANLDFFFHSLVSENDKDDESSDEDEIQSDLPANEKRPPEVGMDFFSEEEAYKFYQRYATELGFSVRRGKVQRLANGMIRKRNFLCSRQGFKWQKISNDHTQKLKRKETRTGCTASIQLTVENGKWLITNFIPNHNHELGNPKKTVIELQEVNLLTYSSSLINLFLDLQMKDPSFFYTIQVDSANRVKNFFWRDVRSLMDYGFFGDVTVFNTTCRNDNLVFASFWGVNHHRECILFGCATLQDETLDSFRWLFGVFTAAMENRQPRTLYSTDESPVLAAAIELVFPTAQHRLGASNISKNAKRKLNGCFEQPEFEESFHKCVFDSQSYDDFDLQWDALLTKFDLRENPWLAQLHKLREKWCHFLGKNTFSAGIELVFDNPKISAIYRNLMPGIVSIADFVQEYAKETQRNPFEDLNCSKIGSSRSRKGMEKHAEETYTSTMFKHFQDELLDSLSFAIVETTVSTFKLSEDGENEFIVTFDPVNSSVTCSCGKFESIGILCGHCIKVLNAKNIFKIPNQYVLKRWTKSAMEGEVPEIDSGKSQTNSYPRKVMRKTLNLITRSVGIEESRNMVEGYLNLAAKKANEILREKGTDRIDLKSVELEYDVDKMVSNSSCVSKSESRSLHRKRKSCENQMTEIEHCS